MDIDFEEKIFFDIPTALTKKYDLIYPNKKFIILSKAVKQVVDGKAKYTDWSKRNDIKLELKVDLILFLVVYD